jgi:hypothetical protein
MFGNEPQTPKTVAYVVHISRETADQINNIALLKGEDAGKVVSAAVENMHTAIFSTPNGTPVDAIIHSFVASRQ